MVVLNLKSVKKYSNKIFNRYIYDWKYLCKSYFKFVNNLEIIEALSSIGIFSTIEPLLVYNWNAPYTVNMDYPQSDIRTGLRYLNESLLEITFSQDLLIKS